LPTEVSSSSDEGAPLAVRSGGASLSPCRVEPTGARLQAAGLTDSATGEPLIADLARGTQKLQDLVVRAMNRANVNRAGNAEAADEGTSRRVVQEAPARPWVRLRHAPQRRGARPRRRRGARHQQAGLSPPAPVGRRRLAAGDEPGPVRRPPERVVPLLVAMAAARH
jgi:hypothetical protein